jgi:hypothetical protein
MKDTSTFIELHHPLDVGYSFNDLDWSVQSIHTPQRKIDNDYLVDMLRNGTGALCMSLKDRNLSFHPAARHYIFSLANLEDNDQVSLNINRVDARHKHMDEKRVVVRLTPASTLLNTPHTLFHAAIAWHAKDYGPGFKDRQRRAQWEAEKLDDTPSTERLRSGPRL